MSTGKTVLPAEIREVSAVLTRARLACTALPGPPQGLPDSLEAAYALQGLSIAGWPDDVAGWKVGGVPADYVERFGETRLAGPIFARSVAHSNADELARMPVFRGGFAAIEPEFVVRLGKTREEDRLFIGAEIASSPIPAINDYGPVAVISDFGNNNGLLIGSELKDWRSYARPVTVKAEIEGRAAGERQIELLRSDVDSAVEFLAGLARRRGFDLPEGSYVSSGAITGVHEAPIGARSRLDFGELGELHLELVEAKPVT